MSIRIWLISVIAIWPSFAQFGLPIAAEVGTKATDQKTANKKAVETRSPDAPKPAEPELPSATIEAVRASANWRGDTDAPSLGPNGRVMYAYGAGLPTIVCAPLRVCMIELQAGEKIVGEPQIGDSVRWSVSPSAYGAGSEAVSAIVLKPLAVGLDTNLVILTDRRAYYVRLVSRSEDYTARVAFAYSDDDNSRKWQQHLETQKAALRVEQRQAEILPAMLTAEKLNFDYRVSGGNEHIRPVRVYDDGSKTYLQMPEEMRNREAPVLLVLGKDGNGEMTNYRVKESTYIVDRLFDRARLVLGAGKKAKGQTVEIVRGSKG